MSVFIFEIVSYINIKTICHLAILVIILLTYDLIDHSEIFPINETMEYLSFISIPIKINDVYFYKHINIIYMSVPALLAIFYKRKISTSLNTTYIATLISYFLITFVGFYFSPIFTSYNFELSIIVIFMIFVGTTFDKIVFRQGKLENEGNDGEKKD